jgi:hypothetical protein
MAARKTEECYIDHDNFLAAVERITGRKSAENREYQGIGTLSEKTVHGVLKNYFEPDEDHQEVALDGYFADIYNADGVIEIQTRSFDKLRNKLSVFLNHYPVTVVYPMPCNKWLVWIDESTGQTQAPRKSPRHFSMYDAFFELYKIKQYLKSPNIRIKLVMMDMEEYKLLNGWNNTRKKGATKYDRIPLGIRQIINIDQPEDYMQFIPYELEDTFTSAEFAKAGGIGIATSRQVLNILHYMGTVSRIGKKGKSYLYQINHL